MVEYFKKIYKDSANSFHNLVKENLVNNNKMFIVTANPETLMIAEKNMIFKKALLDKKTTVVPDGIGVVKGAKILKFNMNETIPGVDLCEKLFEYCNEFKKSLFLLGARENVLEKLVNIIHTDYPNINLCGYENGYIENKQSVFDKVVSLNPDVVLVALGIPAQELLIYNNLEKFNKGIFVGVGGSFDVLSGMKKRAPKAFRRLHLEWLYRIVNEPKRFKRFFSNNIRYILKIVGEKNAKIK